MPRVQITKDMILEAALKILIRDGYEHVNIKTVSAHLGCSTQPISWAFGNMENFRLSFYDYAFDYASQKAYSDSQDVMHEYGSVGVAYINMAIDEPNLVLFLHSDEKRLLSRGGFGGSFDEEIQKKRQREFALQYGVEEDVAQRFMRDMLIYTHGLVSLILLGALPCDKSEAYRMLDSIGKTYMKSLKKEIEYGKNN